MSVKTHAIRALQRHLSIAVIAERDGRTDARIDRELRCWPAAKCIKIRVAIGCESERLERQIVSRSAEKLREIIPAQHYRKTRNGTGDRAEEVRHYHVVIARVES